MTGLTGLRFLGFFRAFLLLLMKLKKTGGACSASDLKFTAESPCRIIRFASWIFRFPFFRTFLTTDAESKSNSWAGPSCLVRCTWWTSAVFLGFLSSLLTVHFNGFLHKVVFGQDSLDSFDVFFVERLVVQTYLLSTNDLAVFIIMFLGWLWLEWKFRSLFDAIGLQYHFVFMCRLSCPKSLSHFGLEFKQWIVHQDHKWVYFVL